MIYITIICLFWMAVLTFFVVKLTNKLGNIEHHEYEHAPTVENKLKKAITEVHQKGEDKIKQALVDLRRNSEKKGLNELAKEIDEHLATMSKQEMDEWLQTDIKQEPSGSIDPPKVMQYHNETTKLPALNRDFKTY